MCPGVPCCKVNPLTVAHSGDSLLPFFGLGTLVLECVCRPGNWGGQGAWHDGLWVLWPEKTQPAQTTHPFRSAFSLTSQPLCWVSGKQPPADAGDIRDVGSIPVPGRSPGEGHGNQVQYSCLENPVDRGTWQGTVHRVTESDTTEATWHTHTLVLPLPSWVWPFPFVTLLLFLVMFFILFHTALNIQAHTHSGRWLAAKPLSWTVKKSWAAEPVDQPPWFQLKLACQGQLTQRGSSVKDPR